MATPDIKSETPQKLEEEYQKAKAEMLWWIKYIP